MISRADEADTLKREDRAATLRRLASELDFAQNKMSLPAYIY
jgi:hypothetical protein